MSTRTNIRPMQVITSGNMSGNLISLPTILQSVSLISYTFDWSGTSPVGTISLQISDNYKLNPDGTVENTGTWNTVYVNVGGTPSTTISISGNTGNGSIDPIKTAAYATRVIYTAGSGSGSLNAYFNGKVS